MANGIEVYDSILTGRQVGEYFTNLILDLPQPESRKLTNAAKMVIKTAKLDKRIADRRRQIDGDGTDNLDMVRQDLEAILRYLEKGNYRFFNEQRVLLSPEQSTEQSFPVLKSDLGIDFYSRLSHVCRGSLDYGVVSNRFSHDSLHSIFYENTDHFHIPIFKNYIVKSNNNNATKNNGGGGDDNNSKLLEMIVKDESLPPIHFSNPDIKFWFCAARNIYKKTRCNGTINNNNNGGGGKDTVLETPPPPRRFLRDAQLLYQLKCKAIGSVVHPFAMTLHHSDGEISPYHWSTPSTLVKFISVFPQSTFSQTVRAVFSRVLKLVFYADKSLLSKNLLTKEDEQFALNFVANITKLEAIVPNVDHHYRYRNLPKTIDVLIRLVALTKQDYTWKEEKATEEEIGRRRSNGGTTAAGAGTESCILNTLCDYFTVVNELQLLKTQLAN